MPEWKLFILVCVANGAPVIAMLFFRDIAACPIDSGKRLADGQPLFGESKTVRGIYASLLATTAAGVIIGVPVLLCLVVALFAMLGDLVSSFIKRRLAKPAGASCPGLDQIPESLFPLLAVRQQVGLSVQAVILISTLFMVTAMVLSKISRQIQRYKAGQQGK